MAKMAKISRYILLTLVGISLSGCASYTPKNVSNLCGIFNGNIDWYEAAVESHEKWGTPINIMMAIMHQESKFQGDVRPERDWFLGFIPLPRRSSAYGFAQAQDPVWGDYIKSTGNSGADRDDFEDAIDFVGWYTDTSAKRLKISKWATKEQYLAYHEGWGGYSRKTYNKKPWLLKVATKVANQAWTYSKQLKSCQEDLDDQIDSWLW
jgi:hypothetical protein